MDIEAMKGYLSDAESALQRSPEDIMKARVGIQRAFGELLDYEKSINRKPEKLLTEKEYTSEEIQHYCRSMMQAPLTEHELTMVKYGIHLAYNFAK